MMGKNIRHINVLIGSNGGLTGVYLARNLREMPNVQIYGADSSDVTVGKYFVDKQCHLPKAADPQFVEALIHLLKMEQIDIYLPTHSLETEIVAENRKTIQDSVKTKFILSPIETYKELNDKYIANLNLSEIGIPVPKLIREPVEKYPIIMKRRIGSGSKETVMIENSVIHKAYLDTCQDISFFQMIHGKEYTVDCLFDYEGILLGYNQRERVKTIGGAVSITQNNNEFDILPWLRRMATRWIFCGCVNFQYILQNGVPYFIDINLRYPSGGLPLTVASGLDIPKLTVRMLCGEQITAKMCRTQPKCRRMYRYFEEIIEE